jgi:hypothetical protein
MRAIIFIFTLLFFLDMSFSQEQPTWNSKWFCVYATYDDATNGTGHNTPSVGIIKENTFIACVTTYNARSFLVPYVNADSARVVYIIMAMVPRGLETFSFLGQIQTMCLTKF